MKYSLILVAFFSLILSTEHLQPQSLVRPYNASSSFTFLTDTVSTPPQSSDMFTPKSRKSGTLAIALSAILPGAGQLYAERYYTIPLIYGFGAFFYSQFRVANNYYKEYCSLYSESVQLDTVMNIGNTYYKNVRDFYRDKRDEFALYLLLTYLLNIMDAYVGATLYDFDVSPQLNGSIVFRYRVPLR